MRYPASTCLALFFFSLLSLAVSAQTSSTIWYKSPAANGSTAFPLGNGRMGAMVFGIPLQDRIQLYERSGSQRSIDLRRGELNLTFPAHKNFKNYKRTLDLNTAVAAIDYTTSDGVSFRREYMASFPDSVIVIRLTAGKKGVVTCELSLKSSVKRYKVLDGQAMIVLTGTSDQTDANGNKLRFVTVVKPWVTRGLCRLQDGIYTIQNADDAVIYAASLSVPSTDKRSDMELVDCCCLTVARAYGKDYPTMKKKHESLYKNLFKSVTLDLGRTAQADKPTDQRMKEQVSLPDPSLTTLYEDYCRYLLISNTVNAASILPLQSLWTEQALPLVERKPLDDWYRSVESWGLSALRKPLFNNACSMADAVTVAKTSAHAIPGGGAACVSSLWNHYLFTGDKAFLNSHFPFMQATARMYLDSLKTAQEERKHDFYATFAQVMAATDVLHTGIKGRLSAEKAFADTLKKNCQPVNTVDYKTDQRFNEWKGGFEEYLAFPSRLADCLLQSHNGYIFVLPALPTAWKDGSITGLRARGGFEVSLSWKNGKLASLSVHSTLGGMCRIRSGAVLQGVGLKTAKGDLKNTLLGVGNGTIDKDGTGLPLYDLPTEPGKTYVLTVMK